MRAARRGLRQAGAEAKCPAALEALDRCLHAALWRGSIFSPFICAAPASATGRATEPQDLNRGRSLISQERGLCCDVELRASLSQHLWIPGTEWNASPISHRGGATPPHPPPPGVRGIPGVRLLRLFSQHRQVSTLPLVNRSRPHRRSTRTTVTQHLILKPQLIEATWRKRCFSPRMCSYNWKKKKKKKEKWITSMAVGLLWI
ncbi:unnamed protein product [Pleuronectes platessa]|uniref:Uncharacterized protein n=1 Tax=Pleuronectes platessa TaxID=8262 RepID=A0A9N7U2Y0_PLEPL|nr:unnamed protein product [Pleuronectes platessa]